MQVRGPEALALPSAGRCVRAGTQDTRVASLHSAPSILSARASPQNAAVAAGRPRRAFARSMVLCDLLAAGGCPPRNARVRRPRPGWPLVLAPVLLLAHRCSDCRSATRCSQARPSHRAADRGGAGDPRAGRVARDDSDLELAFNGLLELAVPLALLLLLGARLRELGFGAGRRVGVVLLLWCVPQLANLLVLGISGSARPLSLPSSTQSLSNGTFYTLEELP